MARTRKYAAGGTTKQDADWTQSSQMGAGQSSGASNPNALGVTAPAAMNITPKSQVKKSGAGQKFGGASQATNAATSDATPPTPSADPASLAAAVPSGMPQGTAGGAGPISDTLAGMASGNGTYGIVPDPSVLAANAKAGYTPGASYPASGVTPSGLKYVEIGQNGSDPNTYTPGVQGTFDPASDPASRDNSTPGYSGAPMYEVFQPNGSGGWGAGYNVPMNTNLNSIGTGPGQTAPGNIPGTTANNYSTLAMFGPGNVPGQFVNPPAAQQAAPAASTGPMVNGVRAAKGGRIGYAKGGVVGDTKPRYVGTIHKHGNY